MAVSFLAAVRLFDDRGVDIIFIGAHFHFHRRRILCQLPVSEMVEEQDDTDADSKRIGNLQYGKSRGIPASEQLIDIVKQRPDIHIGLKGHDGKTGADKSDHADQRYFQKTEKFIFLAGIS